MSRLIFALVICSGSLSASSGNAGLFAIDFDTIYSQFADITVANSVSFRLLPVNPLSPLEVTKGELISGPLAMVAGMGLVYLGVELYLVGSDRPASALLSTTIARAWLVGCLSPFCLVGGVLTIAGGAFCIVFGVAKLVKGIKNRKGRPALDGGRG